MLIWRNFSVNFCNFYRHSVCHALFWLKIRENDSFTKEIPKKLIWWIIFSMRGNFSITVDFTDVINFFFFCVIKRRPNPTTCFTSLHSVLDHWTSISRKITGFFGYFKASFFLWKTIFISGFGILKSLAIEIRS